MKAEGFVKEDEYNLLGNFYITLFFFQLLSLVMKIAHIFFTRKVKLKLCVAKYRKLGPPFN